MLPCAQQVNLFVSLTGALYATEFITLQTDFLGSSGDLETHGVQIHTRLIFLKASVLCETDIKKKKEKSQSF